MKARLQITPINRKARQISKCFNFQLPISTVFLETKQTDQLLTAVTNQ